MRCPNEKCRREIPLDATEHKLCGWRASSTPPPPADEKPTAPPEPEPNPEAAAAAQAKIRAMLAGLRHGPTVDPLTRWKKIAADPNACLFARESAEDAIKQLERRAAAEVRIREEAARQARAREIVERRRQEEESESRAEALYQRDRRRDRVHEPAPPPPPAEERLALGIAKDDLERQFDAEREAATAGDRPANPRAAAPRYVSRGTSGAAHRPNRSGQARARRR